MTLNRPHAANAIGNNLLRQFEHALETLHHSSSPTRCLVLTSSSPRVFSAGADLKERSQLNSLHAVDSLVTRLRAAFHSFAALPFPTIAAVNGKALGGGLELALAADLRIASRQTQCGLPETSLAIIPGAGGTQRLSRTIGAARAKELIYTGRVITAETAREYGIVQYVEEDGQAEAKAMEIALEIVKNGPIAIRAAKEAIDRGLEASTMEEALQIERQCYAKVLPTEDRLEGLAAFQERRKPNYKGQ